MSGLKDIRSLRDQLERRLETNEDFITWRALSEAILRVENKLSLSATERPDRAQFQGTVRDRISTRGRPRKTQTEYAIEVLKDINHPVSNSQLLHEIQHRGGTIGGQNPTMNLASLMSSDPRFQSVSWGNARAWWFIDRPVPSLEDNEKAEAATNESSASSDSTNEQEEHDATT